MDNNLYKVYKYFSHHIRNCTAMIVTSSVLIPDVEDSSGMIGEMSEYSFLLDLFDRAMGICFSNTVLASVRNGVLDILSVIKDMEASCKYLISEHGIQINYAVSEGYKITCNKDITSVIVSIIVYEFFVQSKSIQIDTDNNSLQIKSIDAINVPVDVWRCFEEILELGNIYFTYNDKMCLFRSNR